MSTLPANTNPSSTALPRHLKRIDSARLRAEAAQLLRLNFNVHQLKLNRCLLDQLQTAFESWLADQQQELNAQLKNVPKPMRDRWLEERLAVDRRRPENQAIRFLTDFLFLHTNQLLDQLSDLREDNREFRKTLGRLRTDTERQQLILHYATNLGATPRQLRGDRRAFSRWFDEEAVNDRFLKQSGELELALAFAFERLSQILGFIFQRSIRHHWEEAGERSASAQLELNERLRKLWRRLSLESRLQKAMVFEGDARIHVAVLKCLRAAIEPLPEDLATTILDKRTLTFVHRAALEPNSDVWVQTEALAILAAISMEHAMSLVKLRLTQPHEGDDLFVRREAVNLILAHLSEIDPESLGFLAELDDPSPFVRQKLCEVLFRLDQAAARHRFGELVLNDPVPQVRAAALLVGMNCPPGSLQQIDFLKLLGQSLDGETDAFVIRTGLHVAVRMWRTIQLCEGADRSTAGRQEHPAPTTAAEAGFREQVMPVIRRIAVTAEIPLRRIATQSLEMIWGLSQPDVLELLERLRPVLQSIRPGTSKKVPMAWIKGWDDDRLGRAVALLTQDDFGYDIHRTRWSVRFQRGPRFGFRLWRLYYEFFHPATDKRNGISHTIGRISTATLRVPSQILGELSQTKVPGEPLTIASDGTWRPFLPLPDDFVSVLNLSWLWPRTVRFYSAEGITLVTAPRSFVRRLRAAWRLTFQFADFAEWRNWDEDSFPASRYVRELRGLGFQIEFAPHADQATRETMESMESMESTGTAGHRQDDRHGATESGSAPLVDESVTRFFTSLAPIATAGGTAMLGTFFETQAWRHFQRFADYFSSAFENSLEELVVFAGAVMLFVVLRHLYSNITFRRARRRIPMSIGGWGTRGKSGTERLKAALIGVQGYGLVSKTTGCEAMFIQSHAFGEPLEIPLFRPYDKATIWEHRNLIVLASRLNPAVFLWECMALNPDYVDVLQRQWTCDDLATITNTYPDHEDIQGPAGHNVAQTIAGFVPLNAVLVTTEQQMRPYVRESCRRANTEMRAVGWLESGLIPDDILERFPYREHPDNIALVCQLASLLGIPYERALKAMADYLVPDLGVLKTHPVASVRTRRLEFTNGMSANERFGCMGNWRRLGFDQQDPWADPGTWICGVVNNRADRVPRSKVFAQIMVEDISADRFFLIGSNLKGLQGFIAEAWATFADTLTLRDQSQTLDVRQATDRLLAAARRFRQPIEPQHVQSRLRIMLQAVAEHVDDPLSESELASAVELWDRPDDLKKWIDGRSQSLAAFQPAIVRHVDEWNRARREYLELHEAIAQAKPADLDDLEIRYRRTLEVWFQRKMVVIENYDATGEEIIELITEEVPPGFLARIMGLQNIKGTGLDFVYRFQAWDACYEAGQAALSTHETTAEKGIMALASMPEFGQLCQEYLANLIERCRRNPALQRADLQTLVDQIQSRLPQHMSTQNQEPDGLKPDASTSNEPQAKITMADWHEWFVDVAEQFLDVNDSIRRREQADRIYADLAAGRIGRQRTVVELRKLNKRQKGGWLKSRLGRWKKAG